MSDPSELDSLLSQWEADTTLLEQTAFSGRMTVLDRLDRDFCEAARDQDLSGRVGALAERLEFVNDKLFASIRQQIRAGTCPAEFSELLGNYSIEPGGLGYDYLDDLVAGVLRFEAPNEEPRSLAPDSVFYQPTPARHIFHLIAAAAIKRSDTLIDLGSGLGHVSLLASICAGATSVGIELDPAWVAAARKCAADLNLKNVTFLAQDVREADLSAGSVFYLYTPFTGGTLDSVLQSLRKQAALRTIRICTFGPCTLSIRRESWLEPLTPVATDRIAVFLPR